MYIALAIAAVVVVWIIASYNGLVKMRNMVEEAFATMDVYLKQRYDLIPNLVETVKGYAKHESETFEKIVQARSKAMNAKTSEETVAEENNLTQTLKSLFALAENYPDLKANQNFINLQGQLQKVETDIAQSRKYFNAIVRRYNTKVELFPQSIVAQMFKFSRKTMFEVSDDSQRENVSVKF
ncbi:MAG: LemA family protein [Eubacteriales bacterium]